MNFIIDPNNLNKLSIYSYEGTIDFTYEVDSLLENLNLKENIKREIIIFGQQLMVTMFIIMPKNEIYQKYKLKFLPSATKNLKEHGITSQQVGYYLSTINHYPYYLNYYGNVDFSSNKNDVFTSKGEQYYTKYITPEYIKFMKDAINLVYK
jgi:hypothetical protein